MPELLSETAETYTNPVYGRSFPDPFILKYKGDYYAYCTGVAPDGLVFGILHSQSLTSWTEIGGAMPPLIPDNPHYWAPEVTYYNGKFYLYYSVGNETLMEIRVAVSDRPDGGFLDSGHRMTQQEFAIDPHVHRDEGGQWFMFYATDFLTHSHIGTGTVMERMIDPFTLAGDPRPVTRAKFDWQVYDAARKEKGGVRWHTVEGPYVIRRKGKYYEMFSGGNWQNETYGVSFAVSHDLDAADEWVQYSDGDTTLPILRTIPGRITGPGHNSAVRGPNNRELYCIYHRWENGSRVMAIDRMDFAGGDRLFIVGPTDTPQPAPYEPRNLTDVADLSDKEWGVVSGVWHDANNALTSGGTELDEAVFETGRGLDFHCEFSVRSLEPGTVFGLRLKSVGIDVFTFAIDVESSSAWTEWPGSGGKRQMPLLERFDAGAVHEIAVDVDFETVRVALDGGDLRLSASLPGPPTAFSVFSEHGRVEFGPIELTAGFEELFDLTETPKRGWDHYGNRGLIESRDGSLLMKGEGQNNAVITRNVLPGNFELCLNLRLLSPTGDGPILTFGCGTMFSLSVQPQPVLDAAGEIVPLPEDYSPQSFSQFRLFRFGDSVSVSLEGKHLGTFPAEDGEFVRITVQDAVAEIDMVRYTAL